MITEVFSSEKLIESLKTDVTDANNELSYPIDSRLKIAQIYTAWTGESRLFDNRDKIKKEFQGRDEELTKFLNLYAVGLLGLARIRITDLNAQLKSQKDATTRDEINRKIQNTVRRVYGQFPPENAPGYTIHGNPINWLAEVNQDKAQTAYLNGEIFQALGILHSTIQALTEKIQNTKTTKTEFAADNSALAVTTARFGKMTGSQSKIFQGLWRQRSTMSALNNGDRLKTISQWAVVSGLTDFRQEQIHVSRVLNIVVGSGIRATYFEPKKFLIDRIEQLKKKKNDKAN